MFFVCSRKDASEAADTLNEGQEGGKRKSSSRRRPKSLPPVGDDREEKDDESISDDEFLAKKQRQRKSVSRRAPAKKLSAEDTRVNEEAMLLKRQLLEGRHASNAFSDSEEDDNQDMKSSDEEAI